MVSFVRVWSGRASIGTLVPVSTGRRPGPIWTGEDARTSSGPASLAWSGRPAAPMWIDRRVPISIDRYDLKPGGLRFSGPTLSGLTLSGRRDGLISRGRLPTARHSRRASVGHSSRLLRADPTSSGADRNLVPHGRRSVGAASRVCNLSSGHLPVSRNVRRRSLLRGA